MVERPTFAQFGWWRKPTHTMEEGTTLVEVDDTPATGADEIPTTRMKRSSNWRPGKGNLSRQPRDCVRGSRTWRRGRGRLSGRGSVIVSERGRGSENAKGS